MLKRLAGILILVVALGLQSCGPASGGLRSYANSYQGYQFSYPTGWVEVGVNNGPDVVFHDIINPTENVSVVINPIDEGTSLADLGSPTEVGYKLSKGIMSMAGDDRDVELVNAKEIDTGDGKTYYILEYVANLPSGTRHNLASAIVRRGQLFTFNASVPESRWDDLEILLKQTVASFSVY